jgi:hypothetical protein
MGMAEDIISPGEFYGRWLVKELQRVQKELDAHPLAEWFRALDHLEGSGVDPADRRAIKTWLGQCNVVPAMLRGNREAYERFIDWCLEHYKRWLATFDD